MIKRNVFLIFACCALQSQAQSTFNIGPVYSAGASNILRTSMNEMNMSGEMNSKMSMKINAGAGLKAEYFFKEKWGLFLQTGFQQRGALFKEYMDDLQTPLPFKLLGCHFWRGVSHQRHSEKSSTLYKLRSISTHFA